MPPRAPGPHPHLEPGPSAADPAPVRDPPQSPPAPPLPARCRAAETATRTGRPRPVQRPKTHSRRWPDQRIPPGRMTWTRFSARTRSGLRLHPESTVSLSGVGSGIGHLRQHSSDHRSSADRNDHSPRPRALRRGQHGTSAAAKFLARRAAAAGPPAPNRDRQLVQPKRSSPSSGMPSWVSPSGWVPTSNVHHDGQMTVKRSWNTLSDLKTIL